MQLMMLPQALRRSGLFGMLSAMLLCLPQLGCGGDNNGGGTPTPGPTDSPPIEGTPLPTPTPTPTPVSQTPTPEGPTPTPGEQTSTPETATPTAEVQTPTPVAETPTPGGPTPTPGDLDLDGDGVPAGRDCDDDNSSTYPGADELCDSSDNDCDEEVDEDAGPLWYPDADQDGVPADSDPVQACTAPYGTLPPAADPDCNDESTATYPDADEFCDGEDNDCNDLVDDNPINPSTFYPDADNDGFGVSSSSVLACEAPAGYAAQIEDCDDSDPALNPGEIDACDGIDNNCNGAVDEEGDSTFYFDADDDGYGASDQTWYGCNAPPGYAVQGDDCRPEDASSHPGAVEICDGIDNNCDQLIDEDAGEIWAIDNDGDGAGSPERLVEACEQPPGFVAYDTPLDCDDSDPLTFPDAPELCDGSDNDCDGQIDEDALLTWYRDVDGDGFGDPASPQMQCTQPQYYVSSADDCNDRNDQVNPGASEACDGLDNDCNGSIDEGVTSLWYLDADGDSFGSGASVRACSAPTSAYVSRGGDCQDLDATVFPGAPEQCDAVDDDCDGSIDEDATDATTWYRDSDGDAYGVSDSTQRACTVPAGYAARAGDCNDSDADIHPGASELCNGWDDNCDTVVDSDAIDRPTWYLDGDDDGYGRASGAAQQCNAPSPFYVIQGGDCNDNDPAIYPGADEICDSKDNDCDTNIDEDALDAPTWYQDLDGDTYGNSDSSQRACSQPSGYVSDDTDCNDVDSSIHPDAPEVLNGKDDDCNRIVDDFPPDCHTLKVADSSLPTDFYLVDPDGVGGATPFTVYCDMTTDGGGWTIVYATSNGSAGSRPYESTSYGSHPLYESYKLSGARLGALARGGETLFLYKDDATRWLNVGASFFGTDVWPSHRHSTVQVRSSSGERRTATVAYSNTGNSGGGWYGVTAAGPDHHSTSYYELNGGCASHFVYTYGGNFFAANTAVGSGWPVTAGCSSSGSSTVGMMVGVRPCTGSGCAPPIDEDCAAIKAAVPTAPDGFYQIDPGGAGEFEVYCDMSNAGGGWTYVWSSNNGDPGARPYEASNSELNPLTGKYTLSLSRIQRLEQSEHLVVRRGTSQWLKVGASFFGADVWPAHGHQTVTVTSSSGQAATAVLGYSDTNNGGGGWYGLTLAGPDHHSTSYYELNGGCASHYLYTYGGNYFAVNTGLGVGWSTTSSCSNSSSANPATMIGVR